MTRKPKSEKARETKSFILQAAAQILLTDGIEAFNTNLLAKKAGVSIGSLYQYFEDKNEILFELLSELVERRTQRVREAITVSAAFQSTDKIMDQIVDALIDSESQQESRLEAVLIPLSVSNFQDKARALAEMHSQGIRAIGKIILQAKVPGLRGRNLDVVTFVLSQAMRGVMVARTLPGAPKLDPSTLRKELKLLMSGYLAG